MSIIDGRQAARADEASPEHDALAIAPLDPLALRSTIERQGGTFETGFADGNGMAYVIELPLHSVAVARETTRARAPLARAHEPLLGGLSVMCIDDQSDALESLALILRSEQARVLPFERGSTALDWLARNAADDWPDLLACDISLGEEEDGHAIMRRIRQMEAEREVPLDRRMPAVALTGHARPEDRLRALMAGFQIHLAKPIDPQILVETLARLAGR
jgi:ATP-binding cassette subfamily B protein